ncbi:GLPGLI family protein [Myroides profundi]|uniref:GLPGLI family protein n=1 Tax=Myroides profundi TaxID=480520 RepID=A0AAJ5BD48_MYRPR|nr:GLPGLI family protein [Myroides profundi]AJH14162.1 hypothetical protein MPR_0971 [Myroides profundi]SEQ40163.1 GLPGLI family protein [Myroides profundi]
MKRICFTVLCSVFVFSFCNAQLTRMNNSKPMKAVEAINKKDIDKSRLRVFYDLDFKENKRSVTNAKTVLLIGETVSNYSDFYTLKQDSLQEAFSKQEPHIDQLNALVAVNKKKQLQARIYKNYPEKKVTTQSGFFGYFYQYEESELDIKWKVKSEKQEILGYVCKKATTSFRGRNYVAWYTEEIPISDGPHLFGGLPGLILKLEDATKEYVFTAIGIDKEQQDIYIPIESNIVNTTRTAFLKAERAFYENPGILMQGQVYSSPGKVEASQNYKALPYNPIELE